MAGIVKSTKRRYLIGKRIKEVEVPGTELELTQFYEDATAIGAIQNRPLFESEIQNLHNLGKVEGEVILLPGIYKEGKIYAYNGATKSVADFDFSRNSSASYMDADGKIKLAAPNMPRINFLNGACQGYMVEPSSVNLLRWSNRMTNGVWTKVGLSALSTQQNSILDGSNIDQISPDGQSDAYLRQDLVMQPDTVYSFSFFVLMGLHLGAVALMATSIDQTQSNIKVSYDVRNGQVSPAEVTGGMQLSHVNSTIEPVHGNWHRIKLSFRTGSATITSSSCRLYMENPVLDQYMYVFGAQLEVGSEVTSLISTEVSQQTRMQDSLQSYIDILTHPNTAIYHDTPVFRPLSSGRSISRRGNIFVNFSPSLTPQTFINGVYIPLGEPREQLLKLAVSYDLAGVKAKSDKIALYSDNIPAFVTGGVLRYDPSAIMYIRSVVTFSRILTDSEMISLTGV